MMFKRNILFLTTLLLVLVAFLSVVSASDINQTVLMDTKVPFIENQGQIDDSVSYYANTFYGTSYITNDGITHQINGKDNKSLVIKEEFLDKNGNKILFNSIGEERSTGSVSYYKGDVSSKWSTGINSFNLVNLGELYPGINVKLKAKGSNIEKLFFVKPGANPNDINIRVLGADNIAIGKNGELNFLSNDFRTVSLTKPISYQEGKEIATNYKINDNTYKFEISSYNSNKELIIDPVIEYSSYLGGDAYDIGRSIAVDSTGNVYITGITGSNDFPISPGAYQNNS